MANMKDAHWEILHRDEYGMRTSLVVDVYEDEATVEDALNIFKRFLLAEGYAQATVNKIQVIEDGE